MGDFSFWRLLRFFDTLQKLIKESQQRPRYLQRPAGGFVKRLRFKEVPRALQDNAPRVKFALPQREQKVVGLAAINDIIFRSRDEKKRRAITPLLHIGGGGRFNIPSPFLSGRGAHELLGDIVIGPALHVMTPLARHIEDAIKWRHRLRLRAEVRIGIVGVSAKKGWFVARQRDKGYKLPSGGAAHEANVLTVDFDVPAAPAQKLHCGPQVVHRFWITLHAGA